MRVSRACTACCLSLTKDVDGRDKPDKPGHDAENVSNIRPSAWQASNKPSPSLLDHDLIVELLPLLALIEHLRRIDDVEGDVERLHLHVGGREVAVEQHTLRIRQHEIEEQHGAMRMRLVL